jgi:SAM-dependent methyltransferase
VTGRPSGDADVGAAQRAAWIARHAGRGSVLVVGCAGPDTLVALTDAGARVTVVDAAPENVDRARTAGTGARVERLQSSEWPFAAGSFDRVILDRTLEHELIPERMLEESRRVVRDDGALIIAARYGAHRHGDHADALYLARLGSLLSDAFTLESATILSGHILIEARPGAAAPDYAALLRLAEQRLGEIDADLLKAGDAAANERERADRLQTSLEMMRSSRGWRLAKAVRDGTRTPRAMRRLPKLVADALKRKADRGRL